MYTVYGISNCDTVKKAIAWLRENNIPFEFHDFKMKGISADKLQQWNSAVGFGQLVNTRGTTWRALDDKAKASAKTEQGALKLMQEKTSIIKRPVIEKDGKIVAFGFDAATYGSILR